MLKRCLACANWACSEFWKASKRASSGAAGDVHGGDRLPWVHDGTLDNHASLQRMGWQVHVYGSAPERLRATCVQLGLPLEVFPWGAAHAAAGLERDALYLLRPDTYVALADRSAEPATLTRYFSERALRPQAPALAAGGVRF